VQIEPLSKLSYDEAKEFFKEQMKGLLDGGVDIIVLETFSVLSELIQAVRGARELNGDIPLVAQVTVK